MKAYKKILLMIGFAGAQLAGCSSDEATPNEEEIQLGKLSATWVASSVKKDDLPVDGYEFFELTLSGSAGSAVFAYGVTGRPLTSPWPETGNWAFGSSVSSQIIRDPSTDKELTITYTVTDTALTMDFQFNGTGYDAGRVNSSEGHWTYSFTKK